MRTKAAVLLVLLFAGAAWAAMSVSRTEVTYTSFDKVRFAWTSGADGTARSSTTAALNGRVVGLITDPGSIAPTDNYDITITDEDGDDVLLGAGANRDTANTEYVTEASLAGIAGSTVTLNVSNAGDSKEGVAIIFVEEP